MNKKVLFAIVGIVIVIAGAFAYVLLTPKEESPVQNETPSAKVQNENPKDEPAKPKQAEKGTYVEYSEAALAAASDTRLLFFHAPWCPQCREMEASIEDEGLPDGVTVLKVDYDSSQELRQKYGVTLQTTFVKVDANGNKIDSYVAYDEPQFSSVQRELLP